MRCQDANLCAAGQLPCPCPRECEHSIFTIDTRNIPSSEAKALLEVWRNHNGMMTVAMARLALVPSNTVLAIKMLWYVFICAGVLFVVFVPLALIGLFLGLAIGGFVIGQAQAFDRLLPADCANWKLEVLQ